MKIILHIHKMAIIKKDKKSVDKYVEKLKPIYIASGIIKWCGHFRKQFANSSNVKHGVTV